MSNQPPSIPPQSPYTPPSPESFEQETPPQPSGPLPNISPEQRRSKLSYFEAYSHIFDSPNWLTNVALGAVCQLIPVIGPMVFIGYGLYTVEYLHRRPPGTTYPDFEFDDFTDYLMRGLWAFLVGMLLGLIASVVLVPVFFMLMIIPAVIGAAADDNEAFAMIGFFVLMIVMYGGMAVIGVVMGFLLTPFMLRAGLTQDFGQSFDFGFAMDFYKKVTSELILGNLFLMVTYPFLLMIGLALCFIGIYPAITVFALAQLHIMYQIYDVYLHRGGQLIPMKTDLEPVA